MGQLQSNLDFGPVVKPLGITVKKEAGNVAETSDVVRSQATRGFRKEGQEPRSPKKGGPKNFWIFKILKISKFWIFQKSFVAWCLRRCWYFYCIFWRQKCSRAQRDVCTMTDGSLVTLRGLGHVMFEDDARILLVGIRSFLIGWK